jgi:hypothetical protein
MPDLKPGDEGYQAPALSADTPEVKAFIEAAVKEATSGLTGNRDEILGEKKALQAKFDEQAALWKDLDPEAVRNIMGRLENDEETKLLAEGKMDEVIERRTERLKADHATQITNLETKLTEAVGNYDGAKSTVKELKVEGGLRQAAIEHGLVPSAIEDALGRAMNVFKVGDDGKLLAEENGSTAYGKDGVTPLTPAEWLESMKEKAPHWFPAPSGAGAGGGNGKGGGSHTITRADARDVIKYRVAKEAAEKAGGTLQIVG